MFDCIYMFICLCLADELFHEALRVSSLSYSQYLIAQILPPFTVSACVSDFSPSLAAAIHEFPRDYFTNKQRVEGAVGLHVLCVSVTCSTLHGHLNVLELKLLHIQSSSSFLLFSGFKCFKIDCLPFEWVLIFFVTSLKLSNSQTECLPLLCICIMQFNRTIKVVGVFQAGLFLIHMEIRKVDNVV